MDEQKFNAQLSYLDKLIQLKDQKYIVCNNEFEYYDRLKRVMNAIEKTLIEDEKYEEEDVYTFKYINFYDHIIYKNGNNIEIELVVKNFKCDDKNDFEFDGYKDYSWQHYVIKGNKLISMAKIR